MKFMDEMGDGAGLRSGMGGEMHRAWAWGPDPPRFESNLCHLRAG